jgi:flagellar basal-body rod modification protein FlgD
MSVTGTSSTSKSGSAPTAGVDRYSALTSDDFMKVLLASFQQQDPLKPQDTNQLVQQLSEIRNIESQTVLQKTLTSLVTQNQIASAGNMIGKLVQGLDENNDQVQGVVTSVLVQKDKVYLQLDSGKQLTMDRVTAITHGSTVGAGA